MIKNVNMNFFKSLKGKLLKVVKIKKILLVSLASVIILSGCASKVPANPHVITENDYYNENIFETTTETQQKNETEETVVVPDDTQIKDDEPITQTPIVQTKLDEESIKIIRTEVTLNKEKLSRLISNIRKINVNYQYSDLFGSDIALQRYNSLNEYQSLATKYIVNGKINKELIKETVLNNNKEFLENYSGSRYSEFDSTTFNKVFDIFIEGLEYIVSNNTDIGQLDEKLGDLKILYSSGHGTGEMTDDNTILGINLKIVETYSSKNPNIDYIRTVVLHETNHFGQIHSENERQQEGYSRNLGILYGWNDLKVNPLEYTWYTEGAAELLMTDQYGTDIEPTVYEHNIKSLESLTLSALLRSDVDELTLAKLSYQTDLNELFKIFNCTTDAEKIEVINMMYSFDISLYQKQDFFNAYKEKYGKALDNRYDYFSSLHSSIAQTLTKNFYINLSTYLSNNNATLEDIFFNMSLFETEMSRLTKYTQSNYIDENSDFISMYCDIQQQFFEIVADYFGITSDEVEDFYNAYYADNLSSIATTKTLSDNELEYANRILQERKLNKKNTINEVSDSFKIK